MRVCIKSFPGNRPAALSALKAFATYTLPTQIIKDDELRKMGDSLSTEATYRLALFTWHYYGVQDLRASTIDCSKEMIAYFSKTLNERNKALLDIWKGSGAHAERGYEGYEKPEQFAKKMENAFTECKSALMSKGYVSAEDGMSMQLGDLQLQDN